MNRIENILLRARDSLADQQKQRWSDERLLRLLDEAQKDTVRRAKLLRQEQIVFTHPNQDTYDLPSDLMLLTRVLVEGKPLTFITREELDELEPYWESKEGTPTHVVIDRDSRRVLRVYPKPSDFDELEWDWQFTQIGPHLYTDAAFGEIVSVEGMDVDTFGVVTEVEGMDVNIYGVVSDMLEYGGKATIYYLRKPKEINSIQDELEIDDIFDSAIKYYIVGKALRDDQDTMNRAVGNEELQFYYRELREALNDDSRDFIRAGSVYDIAYKGFV